MRYDDNGPPAAILEVIHAIMAVKSRRDPSRYDYIHDVLGNRPTDQLLMYWLDGQGLLAEGGEQHPPHRLLTDEGHAVLLMLDATRPVPVRKMQPSQASIEQLISLGMGPLPGEKKRSEVEQAAARWDAGFLRRDVAGRSAIVLFRRGDGAMPLLQTVWSLTFDDHQQRDAFYDWLCHRLDRWPAWAEIAGRHSGPELTNHLLKLMPGLLADGDGRTGNGRRATVASAVIRLNAHAGAVGRSGGRELIRRRTTPNRE